MRLTPAQLSSLVTSAATTLKVWTLAVGVAAVRQALTEWNGSGLHLMSLGGPRPEGLGAAPRDFRPLQPARGQAILTGTFPLAGQTLVVGPGGDPWDRPSPSRRFAQELHQFGWLVDLTAAGEAGPREALRLTLDWERQFGRWSAFTWSGVVLERRVFALACNLRRLSGPASDAERSQLALSLARQARALQQMRLESERQAERAAAVALAGAALAGPAGEALLKAGLARLDACLQQSVLPDGAHATRSPEATLELLLDLLSVDDVLLQIGREPPEELARAIDRLTGALRFFTLPDGRLVCAQGGEDSDPTLIEAARAHDDGDTSAAPMSAPHSGYQKLVGGSMHVAVDAGPPASGAWSQAACAHPMALEVVCGKDRLITNTGWSPREGADPALRLTAGGSTAQVGDASAGRPLTGFTAEMLGPRLARGAEVVDVRRHQSAEGVWLELSHNGWADRFGVTHERRLYLDIGADELRGEDRFVPLSAGMAGTVPFTVRFHLHPDVKVSLARDQRSILLQAPKAKGWWLRNDAQDVAIEPSVHLSDGRARRTAQVVLRSQINGDRGGRIRWKLARVGPEQA